MLLPESLERCFYNKSILFQILQLTNIHVSPVFCIFLGVTSKTFTKVIPSHSFFFQLVLDSCETNSSISPIWDYRIIRQLTAMQPPTGNPAHWLEVT